MDAAGQRRTAIISGGQRNSAGFASPEVAKGSEAFLRHADVGALQRKLEVQPDAK